MSNQRLPHEQMALYGIAANSTAFIDLPSQET